MKKISYFIAVIGLFLLLQIGNSFAADQETRQIPGHSSGLENQTGVALTVYNVNLGLVKDRRELPLAVGTQEVRFMDVASQIIPTSVQIRSLKEPGTIHILEQQYEYDLLNAEKMLDKYVGREVKLYSKNPYSEREELVTATLLSNNGGPIFRIGGEITFGHPGRIIFPEVPANLIAKPTLVWLIRNSLASPQTVEASYLTNGITWRADYIVSLNEAEDRADISGWVTIDNRSGATYRDATLKLIAGDVQRVRDALEFRGKTLGAEMAGQAAPQFEEKELFEYHLYSLDRPATIRENQTKQIGLVVADAVPIRKEYIYRGADFLFHDRHAGFISNQRVSVFIEFENRRDYHLGISLPKGTLRVYKNDQDGNLQFVGEDAIDHIPVDEKVRVRLGNAFDIAVKRKQTDWKKLAADTFEAGFEIEIRNRKHEDVVVKVIEPIPGDWTILGSSHGYEKTEAFAAEFMVPVPKDKETKISYRVRMRL